MKQDENKNHNEEQNTEKQESDSSQSEEQVNELQGKLEECENKYKRALADYQNLEKRVREERVGLIRMANRELLLRLLPILDTLFLAQQHSEDQSLKVSVQQFLDALKDEGVTRVETSNKEFDPEVMEAVGTGEGKEGVVLQETRAGFLINDQLLRPAQVIVGGSL